MTSILDEPQSEKPTGCASPAQYPLLVWPYMAIDKYVMKLFGISLVTRGIMKKNGVDNIPCIILRTKGHKSGKMRETILPAFFRDYTDGVKLGVIGSNGGAPKHPAWVYNVLHDPDVEVVKDGKTFKARAHIAEGAEYDLVYGTAKRCYPWFNDYEVTCYPRKIPAIVLEKV